MGDAGSTRLWDNECIGRAGQRPPPIHTAFTTMHPDTLAALRLLVLALEAHPEDLTELAVYGDMPEHLADVISDYLDDEED